MLVYILEEWVPYEGSQLLSIFATKELAEEQRRKYEERFPDYKYFVSGMKVIDDTQ